MGRVLASSLCRETTDSEFCLATKQNFFFCGEEKSPSIDHVAKTKLHSSNTNGPDREPEGKVNFHVTEN